MRPKTLTNARKSSAERGWTACPKLHESRAIAGTNRVAAAVVTLPDGLGSRRDILLGKYGTKRSRVEYARVIAEWEVGGHRLPASIAAKDLTVNEFILAYWKHAEQHYRRADGTSTKELADIRLSCRPLKEMYGHTPAREFGPAGPQGCSPSDGDRQLDERQAEDPANRPW